MSESVLAALAALPGMSSRRLAHLLDGRTVAEAWVLVLAGNSSPPVVPKEHSARWASQLARIELDEISARLAKLKCRVTSWHDDDHPRRFRDDIDPAPVLFRCGELPGPTTPTVGIVGTRRCSGAGKEIAYELGASLSEAGVSVVSGLALGVDGAAHRGAVAAGGARPVAVVGSGIDVAVDVGAASHPFGLDKPTGGETSGEFAKWRTLIHGDAKAANVFLRDSAEHAEGVEIGLIDFQWMGFGLGVVDATHVIAASVDPQALGFPEGDTTGASLRDGAFNSNAAHDLFKHYYEEFIDASVLNGAAGSSEEARALWPMEEAAEQYDCAILDFSRVVFGYQWVRVGASPESLQAAAESYNKNSYNKSLLNALWLVRECDAALKRRQAAAVRRCAAERM